MKKLHLLAAIFFCLFFSCKDEPEVEKTNEILANNEFVDYENIDFNRDTILSYKITKMKDAQCAEWDVPKKEQIIPILKTLVEVDSRTWNECYGDWSCGAEGELIYNKEICSYRIDAGGWIIMGNERIHSRFFVCKHNNECWKHFASECFCDKEFKMIDSLWN